MASREIPLEEPPPPPLELFGDVGGGRNFPPLVVAAIPVLVGAFILISYYYTIVKKYCGTLHSGGDQEFYDDHWREERWDSDGLDDASIAKLSVRVYGSGDGLVGVAGCSVCLGEFREAERLRSLPVCGHAFHLRCIDAWLRARANCPLCRANALPVTPPPESPLPPAEPLVADGDIRRRRRVRNHEAVDVDGIGTRAAYYELCSVEEILLRWKVDGKQFDASFMRSFMVIVSIRF